MLARDVFLVVLSPDALASQWVQREIQLAFSNQKRIIPLLFKQVQLSGFITLVQYKDVIGQSAWAGAQMVSQDLALPAPPPTRLTPSPQGNAPVPIRLMQPANNYNQPYHAPLALGPMNNAPKAASTKGTRRHPLTIAVRYGLLLGCLASLVFVLAFIVYLGVGYTLLALALQVIIFLFIGYYAGRCQRLRHPQNPASFNPQAILWGTGAGALGRVIAGICSTLLQYGIVALIDNLHRLGISYDYYHYYNSPSTIIGETILGLFLSAGVGTLGGLLGEMRGRQIVKKNIP